MRVCIHQPDFMPWLGFFVKIMKSDIWVLLDHVENNPRDSAFWGRRVKFALEGSAEWISIPLLKDGGRVGMPIHEIKINMDISKGDYRTKNLKRIEFNYHRAPYFDQIFPVVQSYFLSNQSYMIERNMEFISKIFQLLDYSPKIIKSSSLNCTQRSNELLLEIINKVGGTTYVSGDGASSYMDLDRFAEENIIVEFNRFKPFPYLQHNTTKFLPGLSIADILMNLGPERTVLEIKKYLQNEDK